MRAGQDLVINTVFNALKEENHVVLSAPNGFGKTITILASVLPIIKENDDGLKIVYLCRTHIQSQHVIHELDTIIKHLNRSNYVVELGGISLRGRSSMCFHPQILQYARDPLNAQLLCSELRKMDQCQYDLNLKENPKKLADLLQKMRFHAIDASELLEICRNWQYCPYQVSKLVLNGMDVIVGSYQWMFSPFIREFFLENIGTTLRNIILILDEAHNVPEVAREISSDQLTYFAVRQMIREAETLELYPIIDFGENLLKLMDALKDKVTDELPISPQLTLKKAFQNVEKESFIRQIIQLGEKWQKLQLNQGKNPRSFLYSVGTFWLNWLMKQNSSSYFFCASKFYTKRGNESLKLEIISLDPKDILKPLIKNIYASINISGTIEPIHYYSDIVGLPDTTVELSVPSPFPKENILVLAMKNLSTKGTSRTSEMYNKYIIRCREAVEAIPKNVGIFTASYDVLNGLIKNGILKALKSSDKEIFYEQPNLTSNQNDQIIARFKRSASKKGGVLLGVCGGRNAEGEDFPGDLMNGVILCGVPFAKPTSRIKAIIDYYGGSQRGKDYAYNMPAFRRANQAAGRPIRTLTDKGVIILLDYRFNLPFYKRFLTPWLRNRIISLPDGDGNLAIKIRSFWK
ncbi:MAG: ATP-dependent DNA helicase [Candidatus Helarchaeota archaeon]|nr:ATP-dependent DNA helicase [Candidatus Helarchaeota archaeon]